MRRYNLTREEVLGNPNGPTSFPIIRTYITYGECQKNQAAHIGGHSVDGCGEFIPSGAQGTAAALICAACNCQRSYHQVVVRREVVQNGPPPPAHGA